MPALARIRALGQRAALSFSSASSLAAGSSVLWALLALVAVALFVGGFLWGRSIERDRNDGQRGREIARQFDRYAEQVREGEEVASGLQQRLREQATFQRQLTERSRDVPLATRVACAARGAAVPPRDAGAIRPGLAAPLVAPAAAQAPTEPGHGAQGRAADPAATAPPGALADAAAADAGVGLTLGAVSLWNSALRGELVAAGACLPDGARSTACAAAAGVELEEAWRNHALNAATCSADRTRLGALQDWARRVTARP